MPGTNWTPQARTRIPGRTTSWRQLGVVSQSPGKTPTRKKLDKLGELLASEPDVDPTPDKDTVEYIEYLIEKATPRTDAPMIVDWIPHVINLVGMIKELREEYSILRDDYEELRERRRKELWKS